MGKSCEVSHVITVDDLERIRKQAKAMTRLRESAETTKIVVEWGTCGFRPATGKKLKPFMNSIKRRNILVVGEWVIPTG